MTTLSSAVKKAQAPRDWEERLKAAASSPMSAGGEDWFGRG